ncbi:hypothetical protein JCM33374_g584 [Metschnikowia sp. JCM 33374]|nr:hypothetical protein JCM33374_g584 [Metschnikowia sp. JCM 33374]
MFPIIYLSDTSRNISRHKKIKYVYLVSFSIPAHGLESSSCILFSTSSQNCRANEKYSYNLIVPRTTISKQKMTDLHDLCRFPDRPIEHNYLDNLKFYLKAGIPATYTIEEAYNYTNGIEDTEPSTTTTPLHLIFTHFPLDYSKKELEVVQEMVSTLFEYGAGWCLTDVNDETPGCILLRRNLGNTILYNQVVDAGVRAELLLRKVSEFDMEVIEDTDGLDHGTLGEAGREATSDDAVENLTTGSFEETSDQPQNIAEPQEYSYSDPSHNQDAYLKTKLQYKDGALVTKDQQDGVMMEWERDLMKLGCDSLFKGKYIATDEVDSEVNILNIGFGMGIIDGMISQKNPTKHYICEAHPDVLKKLKDDGWYKKPNVVILEGRWQEQLDKLLSSGKVYFNGIYYDTFSEHYQDMLELFDYVVGLMKPHGVFSFFNGLGADRQVIYEVYKKLVEIDLENYGLTCQFKEVEVPETTMKKGDTSVWDGIRKEYWSCPTFYHPEARFLDSSPMEISTLSNGLRVVTDSTPGHFSALGAYVNAGSRYETNQISGISHILDVMAWKSTHRRTGVQMMEDLARLGGNYMCGAQRESILYQSSVFNKDTEKMFECIAETIKEPKLSDAEFEEAKLTGAYELEELSYKHDMLLPEVLHEAAYSKKTLGMPIYGTLDSLQTNLCARC